MPTRSWDIRYQSRKLSEIAQNFGRYFALQNFRGPAFQKLYIRYDPCLAARRMENGLWRYSTSPEVIVANTLNFKPNFKFAELSFFFGGGPPSQLGCALGSLDQSLARIKNFRAQNPQWPKCSFQKNIYVGWSI